MPENRGSIFISYRREDTRHIAGRLADTLAASFGANRVFMDVESIEPGLDFAEAIDHAVAQCDVLIALIGPEWVSAPDAQGRRRIDDSDDFVTLEVEAALRRNVRVIPVLVDSAGMPSRDQLPESLQPLARRNAVRLDHESYRTDTANLLDVLRRILEPEASPDTAREEATPPSAVQAVSSESPPAPKPTAAASGMGAGAITANGDAAGPEPVRNRPRPIVTVWAALGVVGVVLVSVLLLNGGNEPPSQPSDSISEAGATESKTLEPETVTCWNGRDAASVRACPRPVGRAGLTSVFPSMTQACRFVPAPVVDGKSEVYLCERSDFIIRYTQWTPGPGRVPYYNTANPGASKATWLLADEDAGFQWTSFDPSSPEDRRFQWSATYVAHPYSVSVEARSDAARARGIQSVDAVPPSLVGARS